MTIVDWTILLFCGWQLMVLVWIKITLSLRTHFSMDIIDKQLLSINHKTTPVVKTRLCAQTEIPTVWQNKDDFWGGCRPGSICCWLFNSLDFAMVFLCSTRPQMLQGENHALPANYKNRSNASAQRRNDLGQLASYIDKFVPALPANFIRLDIGKLGQCLTDGFSGFFNYLIC